MSRERRRRIIIRNIAIHIVVLLCIIVGTVLYIKYKPNTKRKEPAQYYAEKMAAAGAEGDVLTKEDELAIVLQDHVISQTARLVDGEVYLDYDLVRSELNSRFFWDEGNQMVIFTTPLETYEILPESKEYTIDGETQTNDAVILKTIDGKRYMNAEFVQKYTNLEYTAVPEEKHILINYIWGNHLTAQVAKNTAVRELGGIKSLILTEAEKGDTVYILEQMENWSQVVTKDGYIGYIKNKYLQDIGEKEIQREFEAPEYTSIRMDEKVNLVWHQIDLKEMNGNLAGDTENMKGVNVISPTWFFLTDNEGSFDSFADKAYVKAAHKKGLQVWGLISNFSPNMSTTTLLSSTEARRKLAESLVAEALECGLDGINLDLEAIKEEAGESYVQFVREMSILCRKNNLVLSVDVPVPMSFNQYYNRKELGNVVDYVIIMGYDEHYYGSEAGSVASLSFEENGITGTLADVPAEKIISGIPFYTRLWYTQPADDGSISTWSEIIGMNTTTNTLNSYGVEMQWKEELGQNYAAWVLDNGITCQIWVEDEESIAKKASLVKQYNLGGIAEWVLGNQRDTIWDVITENIA